jgi:hypothetical protein
MMKFIPDHSGALQENPFQLHFPRAKDDTIQESNTIRRVRLLPL